MESRRLIRPFSVGLVLCAFVGLAGSAAVATSRAIQRQSSPVSFLQDTIVKPDLVVSNGTDAWIATASGDVIGIDEATGSIIRVLDAAPEKYATGLALSDGHLWVSTYFNVVVEIDPSSGAQQAIISGSKWFDNPDGIAADPAHVWVTNLSNGELTEINALDGAPIRVVHVSSSPRVLDTVQDDGSYVWVESGPESGLSFSEFRVASSALVRVLRPAGAGFAFTSDGTHLWDATVAGTEIKEFDEATGASAGAVTLPPNDETDALASSDGRLWVSNPQITPGDAGPASLLEYATSTLALTQTVVDPGEGNSPWPYAISTDSSYVLVTNHADDTVLELDASTGSIVRQIRGTYFGFLSPSDVASSGTNVWVANTTSPSIAEFDSRSASPEGTIVLPPDDGTPVAFAAAGTHLWVLGDGSFGPCVVELDQSSGVVVRTIRGADNDFSEPLAIAAVGSHVYVANASGNSVTELDQSTGELDRVFGANYRLRFPVAIAGDGNHVWVVNQVGNSVTELNATTGALVRVLRAPRYRFSQPVAISTWGARIWITNADSPDATELSGTSGELVRVVRIPQALTLGPVATDGSTVWLIGDPGGNAFVDELDGATGEVLRVLTGPGISDVHPVNVAANGQDLWLVGSDSVTQVPLT